MARQALTVSMIATAGLLSLPVLAQTAPGANSPAPVPAPAVTAAPSHTVTSSPSAAVATPHTASPSAAMTSPAPSPAVASTPKYFTADHKVRVGKVVGASVYNEQDQSVGSIDDVLMGDSDHKADVVVISVGGFLGMGAKLVSVPFDQLKIQNDKIVMPGATKESVNGMPEYHYTNA